MPACWDSRAETEALFPAIERFAEIGPFLLPAGQNFISSGMYVRLAFAIAASVNPDILNHRRRRWRSAMHVSNIVASRRINELHERGATVAFRFA